MRTSISTLRQELVESRKKTRLPSGENFISLTGFLKLKWCRTVDRLKLTRIARPSVRYIDISSCKGRKERREAHLHRLKSKLLNLVKALLSRCSFGSRMPMYEIYCCMCQGRPLALPSSGMYRSFGKKRKIRRDGLT